VRALSLVRALRTSAAHSSSFKIPGGGGEGGGVVGRERRRRCE
jgi:hypothetical protein